MSFVILLERSRSLDSRLLVYLLFEIDQFQQMASTVIFLLLPEYLMLLPRLLVDRACCFYWSSRLNSNLFSSIDPLVASTGAIVCYCYRSSRLNSNLPCCYWYRSALSICLLLLLEQLLNSVFSSASTGAVGSTVISSPRSILLLLLPEQLAQQ